MHAATMYNPLFNVYCVKKIGISPLVLQTTIKHSVWYSYLAKILHYLDTWYLTTRSCYLWWAAVSYSSENLPIYIFSLHGILFWISQLL